MAMLETLILTRAIDVVIPVIVVLGIVLIGIICFLVFYRMSRRMRITNVEIPSENREETDGKVIKCRYVGSAIIEWGVFVNKQRPIYALTLDIEIEGQPHRLKARIALADEQDRVAANDAKCIGRRFGKGKPFVRGEILRVEYDKTNPNRGNIVLDSIQVQDKKLGIETLEPEKILTDKETISEQLELT